MIVGASSVLFLFVFVLGWDGDGLDETGLGDAVVVLAVKRGLKTGQVLVAQVEAAVVAHPVGECIDADVAHVVTVHVREQTLTIQLQLVPLLVDLNISLHEESEEGSELFEPRALEELLLFDAEVG